MRVVQRVRLCAMQAITVQALLAANAPGGKCASATRTARQWTLHLPARWPWQQDFIRALARIRALPAAA
jgi:hypothetical protein